MSSRYNDLLVVFTRPSLVWSPDKGVPPGLRVLVSKNLDPLGYVTSKTARSFSH